MVGISWDRYQRVGGFTNGHAGVDSHELPVVEWQEVCVADWAGRELPERKWILPDWIPLEQTTALYGIGGVSKTDWLIQLAVATACGLSFCGYQLTPQPVYGLFCEDTKAEILRRVKRIATHYGVRLAQLGNLHFVPLVGFGMTEFVTFMESELLPCQALRRFDLGIIEHAAKLVLLDTLPDFFGGSEINRREVSQFVRQLDAISMARECAIVFSAHPSLRGESDGTLSSGSTGWGGKVRARLSLHDPGDEDNDEDEAEERRRKRQPVQFTDRRILTRHKSNYARQGETIELVYRDGVFTTAALDPERAIERGPMRNAACDAKFLDLLTKITAQGDYVHNSRSAPDRYAPNVFATRPDGKPFTKAEYRRAMQRLFAAGRLRMEPFGTASRGRMKLIEAQP